MGRKRTFAGTQIARVIDDAKLPNSVRKGALTALLQDTELVESILEELASNIGIRAERFYDFAKNGHYVHGLPSGAYATPGDALMPAVKAVLDVVHGAPVTMAYAEYGPANTLHHGWLKLVELHGYNPETNELGVLTATNERPTYLHDMVVVVPESLVDDVEFRSLEQWGESPRAGFTVERLLATPTMKKLAAHSPVEVRQDASQEGVRVEYVWKNLNEEVIHDSFFIPVTGYDANADYFHARYMVGGQTKFVIYKAGSGTYPTLDALVDPAASTSGQYFPFLYFRQNKVSEIEDKNTESYRDAVKLANILGMSYDQVAEGVDANPDIDDVDQAIMMFAVPASTDNQQERKYLYQYFEKLFLAQSSHLRFRSEAQADVASAQLFGSSIQPPGVVIQDSRFKMSLSNRGIYRIRKAGTVAPVGQYSSGVATFNVSIDFLQPETQSLPATTITQSVPVTYHYYRRQVTEGVYDELQVVALQTHFFINGGYQVTGDELDKILLVPLDHSITESYPVPDREILYARALHFVFNCVTTIKLKWYQTGLFQIIMIIVAVIITYFTWGSDGGSALASALALGNYALAFNLIIMQIIEFVIAKLIFKLFVKAVGVEAAFVIAIVAAIVGVGMNLQSSGALTSTPWADQLLMISSGITQAVGAQIQSNIGDLLAEMSEFQQYVDEQLKLIESAQALLEPTSVLSPFVIFGEKPEEFYNRTVHSGNIGTVGVSAISVFVDVKLALPKLSETINLEPETGDIQYDRV